MGYSGYFTCDNTITSPMRLNEDLSRWSRMEKQGSVHGPFGNHGTEKSIILASTIIFFVEE